jgi:hypothetical protein
MAEEIISNNTITIEGRKLLVRSLVNGIGIQFTHFSIGDGEAPAAPENLTELVHELFTVNVSKTQASSTEKGVSIVRGSFTNSNEKGDFYWRELGLYAREAGTENEPVLFGYINYEDKANYIPSVGANSVIEQGIIMQIVTGSATVIYLADPTSKATLQDIDECIKEVEEKLAVFSEEHLNSIEAQISTLQESISAASDELGKATEGFVLKAGDTMTGDLNMGGNKLVGNVQGDVDGSAREWEGWKLFSSVSELGLTEENTMLEVGKAMPENSRLLHSLSNISAKPDGYPAQSGILEIIKFTNLRCAYTFTDILGHRWHSCMHSLEPEWKGWILSDGSPVGSMQMFAGTAAPFGYLLCQGQSLSTTSYAALFAVIGYTYGGSGDKFNLPDFRGVFPRGFDAGRGMDSGRKLGTQQQSGAPNITGTLNAGHSPYGDGVFSIESKTRWDGVGGGGSGKDVSFNAARSSSVYQDGLTEVRPVNLAVNFIIKY